MMTAQAATSDRVISSLQQKASIRLAVRCDRFTAQRTDVAALQTVHDESGLGVGKLCEHVEIAVAVAKHNRRAPAEARDQFAADQLNLPWSVHQRPSLPITCHKLSICLLEAQTEYMITWQIVTILR